MCAILLLLCCGGSASGGVHAAGVEATVAPAAQNQPFFFVGGNVAAGKSCRQSNGTVPHTPLPDPPPEPISIEEEENLVDVDLADKSRRPRLARQLSRAFLPSSTTVGFAPCSRTLRLRC